MKLNNFIVLIDSNISDLLKKMFGMAYHHCLMGAKFCVENDLFKKIMEICHKNTRKPSLRDFVLVVKLFIEKINKDQETNSTTFITSKDYEGLLYGKV